MSIINKKSIATIGIGFGALAIASIGFLTRANEVEVFNPIQVYLHGYDNDKQSESEKEEKHRISQFVEINKQDQQIDLNLNDIVTISNAFDFVDSTNESFSSNVNQEKPLDTVNLSSAQQSKQLVNENAKNIIIPDIAKVANIDIGLNIIDNQKVINSNIENIIYKSQDQEKDLEAILLSMMTLNIL